MNNLRTTLVSLVMGVGFSFFHLSPVAAQTKIIEVEDKIAQTQPTTVSLNQGKATAISFENDEVITFVLLSDQSKNVYTLNAPIESGQAQSIFLRQIKTLKIPGTTTNKNPNLFVVTTNAQGKQKNYQFTINNDSDVDSYQIAIEPELQLPLPKIKLKKTIVTALGEAQPKDIELGLKTNLEKGLLQYDDPVVFAVREYIALTMNGSSVEQAIQQVDVPLSLLQQLGKIGLQEDARRRLMPLPSWRIKTGLTVKP